MKIIRLFVASIALSFVVRGADKVPEVVDVGDYSIKLPLNDNWRVEVYKDRGRVLYKYLETHRTLKTDENIGVKIEVMKVILPMPKEEISIDKFLDKLVQEDPLEYRMAVFGYRFSLSPYLESKKVAPFGYTKHYSSGGNNLWIRVSAIVKAYDRNSLVVYLIAGLENDESRVINPVWLGKVDEIVEGIREIKTPAPKAGK